MQEELVFKKKHRPLRIRLPDQALKKIIIDETEPVSMLMSTICKKIHLNNPDEFALQVSGSRTTNFDILINRNLCFVAR